MARYTYITKTKNYYKYKYWKYVYEPWTQPVMSANGTMGGNNFAVSASSELDAPRPAYCAFDNATDSTGASKCWHSAQGLPAWIQFYNPVPLKVSQITITNRGSAGAYLTNYGIAYSDDGSTFTEFVTGTHAKPTAYGVDSISIDQGSHKYWRINCYTSSGENNTYVAIDEIDITATYKTGEVVESTSDDYDYTTTIEGTAEDHDYVGEDILRRYTPAIRTRNYYKIEQQQDGYNYTLGSFDANTATISSDYIASGFSSTNFLTVPVGYKSNNNAEYCIKFTTGGSVTSSQAILHAENLFNIEILETGAMSYYNWGTSSNISLFTAKPNTTYWFKVTVNGTTRTHSYSTDGISYTSVNVTDSKINPSANYPLRLGTHSNSSWVSRYFTGTIDLKETYININGERAWDAAIATPRYVDIEVPATADDYEYYRDVISNYSPATRIRKYYKTKYWKYVWGTWTQPVLTSNTSYGTITASGYYSDSAGINRYPWCISDGVIPTGNNGSDCWGTHDSATGWVNWKLPIEIKILGITVYNRFHSTAVDYNLRGARFYTDSTKSIPIGEEFSITTSGASYVVANIPQEGILTDNLYFYKTGDTYSGIGEIKITATYRTGEVIESISTDYDYTTEVEGTPDNYDRYEDII